MTCGLRWTMLSIPLLVGSIGGASAGEMRSMPELVRQRTGIAVPWSPDDRHGGVAIGDTVRTLLGGELTADRAVRVALLNSRALQGQFEEIGISRADFRQALLPRNLAIEGEIRFGSSARNPGELIVMQDLTSILLTPLRRRAASSALRQATLRASNAALELAAETRSAFFGMQAAEQARTLWEKTAASAQAAADLARRQHEVGNITDLDLENQQAVYEEAKIELARRQTEALTARERLNQAMGTWGEMAGWRVAAQLPALPSSDGSLEGLEGMAVAQRLDLAAAQAETEALAAQVPVARFSQFPELRAGVHFEREPEGTRTTGPAVELALPLFDRGQHAVARTRAQLRQAQDRHAALAASVRSEVRVARGKLVAARQLVDYYRDVVLPRRRRIVEQTQLELNAMLIGVYQLLQAKQAEVSAQRDYISAQRDYWIARAELERAIGGPLAGAE